MSDATTNNQRVQYSTYLSIFHLLILLQLQLQSNACLFVCFAPQSFSSITDVDTSSINILVTTMSFPPSATRTPHRNAIASECRLAWDCGSASKTPSSTWTCRRMMQHQHVLYQHLYHHDVLLQVQPKHHSSSSNYNPERDPTMATAIVTLRQHSSGTLEKERTHCWQWS